MRSSLELSHLETLKRADKNVARRPHSMAGISAYRSPKPEYRIEMTELRLVVTLIDLVRGTSRQKALQHYDIGFYFGNGGVNTFAVRRPGDTTDNGDRSLPEVRDPSHGTALGGEDPKIRSFPVDKGRGQHLAVRR